MCFLTTKVVRIAITTLVWSFFFSVFKKYDNNSILVAITFLLGYFLIVGATKAMVIMNIIFPHFLMQQCLISFFILVFSYKRNNNSHVDDEHHLFLVYYVNVFLEQQKVQQHCNIILIFNFFPFVILQLLVYIKNIQTIQSIHTWY